MGETYENLLTNVTPTMSDTIRVVTSGGNTKKSTMGGIASVLLEEDTGVDYDTTAQTVKGAINELESDKAEISIVGSALVIN